MGLREFSAPPAMLLEVKKVIIDSNIVELEKHCYDLFANDDADRILSTVKALNHLSI